MFPDRHNCRSSIRCTGLFDPRRSFSWIARTALALVLAATASAQGGLSFADVTTGGTQLGGNSAVICSTGRWVAFTTILSADPLDTNGVADVYLRDTYLHQTSLVSRTSTAGGNGYSDTYGIQGVSSDGRYVLFASSSTNLIGAADTNGATDLFVHDMLTHANVRANVGNAGQQASAPTDYMRASMTDDGRYVVYSTRSSNLVPGDGNASPDVFRWDRSTGFSTLVSVSTGGGVGNGGSGEPSISTNTTMSVNNGRYVSFSSYATNLVASDANGSLSDAFLRDMNTGVTTIVSLSTPGNTQGFAWPSGGASVSDDGRFVAFGSLEQFTSTSISWTAVYVRDRNLNVTTLISPNYADGNCYWQEISGDGTKVAFQTDATNIDLLHHPGAMDTYLHDRSSVTTTRITTGPAGDGSAGSNGSDLNLGISSDGRAVAFTSDGDNLITGDSNLGDDVFVWRAGPQPLLPFCFGDGSGTACPCANNSAPGVRDGCLNSLGTGGRLRSTGTSSLSADTVVLLGSQMPSSSALYFQGTLEQSGGAGVAFGDGLRCATGAILRLGTKMNAGGVSQYPGAGDPTVSVKGLISVPGSRTYQVWYRNAASFCTVSVFNLTNGLIAVWTL